MSCRVLVWFLEPCSASRISGLINPDEDINIAVEMEGPGSKWDRDVHGGERERERADLRMTTL